MRKYTTAVVPVAWSHKNKKYTNLSLQVGNTCYDKIFYFFPQIYFLIIDTFKTFCLSSLYEDKEMLHGQDFWH